MRWTASLKVDSIILIVSVFAKHCNDFLSFLTQRQPRWAIGNTIQERQAMCKLSSVVSQENSVRAKLLTFNPNLINRLFHFADCAWTRAILQIFGRTAMNSIKHGPIGFVGRIPRKGFSDSIIASRHATVKERFTIEADWIVNWLSHASVTKVYWIKCLKMNF